MNKSRISDSQILSILKQVEAGAPASQLCREHGMSAAIFYKWRCKYAALMTRMKQLEGENHYTMSLQNTRGDSGEIRDRAELNWSIGRTKTLFHEIREYCITFR